MTFQQFLQSLDHSEPPPLSPALLALWHDGKGNWHAAHDVAQDIHTPDGSWIHAYLHRKLGNRWNAGYWYRQAGKPMPAATLEEEWKMLVQHFLP